MVNGVSFLPKLYWICNFAESMTQILEQGMKILKLAIMKKCLRNFGLWHQTEILVIASITKLC